MTKLLAIAASIRPESLNKQLLTVAVAAAKQAGAEVTTLDFADHDAPNVHVYSGPLPANMQAIADALLQHDGLILATPEYNWSIPGALKNLIDWMSIDTRAPLKNRTALLLSATPSTRGGVSALLHTRVPLEVLGMWVYPQVIGIGQAGSKLGSDTLKNEKEQKHLATCVTDFVRVTNTLSNHA
ncbi:MAG: NADPH-dependent FMN reductase [Rickettsiales bacterium]